MPRLHFQIFALAAMSTGLGGCTSFLEINLANRQPVSLRMDEESASLAGNRATEIGRNHLSSGNPGLAIEAFQRALASGEDIAPAANGLGVAFARVGRHDLAKRFFEQAMAAAPEVEAYSANLSKLLREARTQSGALTGARAALLSARDASRTVRADAPSGGHETTNPRRGAMQRISSTEVSVITLPPRAAPLGKPMQAAARQSDASAAHITVASRRAAHAVQGFQPLIRFSIAEGEIPAVKPYVRIDLGKPGSPAGVGSPGRL